MKTLTLVIDGKNCCAACAERMALQDEYYNLFFTFIKYNTKYKGLCQECNQDCDRQEALEAANRISKELIKSNVCDE